MKRAVWAFAVALVLAFTALAFVFERGEDTRDEVREVERRVVVDPCDRPKSRACQRRIALVLRALVKRRPDALRRLGFDVRELRGSDSPNLNENLSSPGGGGADSPPKGNGPTGRVREPRTPPPAPQPEPPSEPPRPLLELEAPVPLGVCVGELVRVNCD